ncbi:MAG: hypothetical protein ACJ76S_06545 [Solirubrobacteraceae bacterium]
MDAIRRIADAVLYEGYVLWPYRRSAIKNQRRWTFGGVYPEAHAAARDGDDPSTMQTQCLLEGDGDTALDVGVRFLHVVERQVLRAGATGLEPVDELEVADQRHLSWQEATERELTEPRLKLARLGSPRRIPIRVAAGSGREELRDVDGRSVGALERSWRTLEGSLEVSAQRLGERLARITVRVSNASPYQGDSREEALRQTFCSTHCVLRVTGGRFVSMTDPPPDLQSAAQTCRNVGTWPVLVGEEGDRSTVLSSPIILPDYPQVAPESPGDLFDASEIDQLLVLNILSLTDEEKREMRDSDPRAREILERTESLSEEELMRLHGAIREFGMARSR